MRVGIRSPASESARAIKSFNKAAQAKVLKSVADQSRQVGFQLKIIVGGDVGRRCEIRARSESYWSSSARDKLNLRSGKKSARERASSEVFEQYGGLAKPST